MENISRTFFVLVAMFLSLALEANDKASQSPCIEYNVLESDQNRYTVDVTINKYNESVINLNNTEYTRLLFDNNCTTTNVGEPQLPMISWMLCIPDHKEIHAYLSNEIWEEINIGTIQPYQGSCTDENVADIFSINQATYNLRVYQPQILNVGNRQRWREYDNSNIRVCPFEYYPVEGKLKILKSFTLNVEFVRNSSPSYIGSTLRYFPISENPFDNQLFNNTTHYNTISESANTLDYLIIAADSAIINSYSMKEFLMWKRVKGFRPEVVSTAETGNSCDSIKNFIKHHYNIVPRFVLFVGDHDAIPSHYQLTQYSIGGGNTHYVVWSDSWYSFLDGDDDYQPDFCVARLPVRGLSDFENITRKIITYYLGNNLSTNKALLMAHRTDSYPSYIQCSENIKNVDYGMFPATDIQFDIAYGSNDNGNPVSTNQDVINKINNGVHILNYRGHGLYDRWGFPWNTLRQHFTTNSLDSLTNTSYPIVFSFACETSDISQTELCMMEKFLNSANGAVAFYGASSASLHETNSNFDSLLFDKIMTSFSFGLGQIIRETNFRLQGISSTNAYRDHISMYMIGGDPTLEIYTNIPRKMRTRMTIDNNNFVFRGDYNGRYLETFAYLFNDNYDYIDAIDADIDNTIALNNLTQNCYVIISRNFDRYYYIPNYLYINVEGGVIQNREFNLDCWFRNTPLEMGRNVDREQSVGDVIIKEDGDVDILNLHGVKLSGGFYCERGGRLKIHN